MYDFFKEKNKMFEKQWKHPEISFFPQGMPAGGNKKFYNIELKVDYTENFHFARLPWTNAEYLK